jgi:hypothetical protein
MNRSTPGRRWAEGLTLAEATGRVADNERYRAKPDTGGRIPPRRVVPFTTPSGVEWK